MVKDGVKPLLAANKRTWNGGFGAQQGDDMAYNIPPPSNLPEPGYYYHFKHDPDGPINNYAYYIHGVGHHTEDDC